MDWKSFSTKDKDNLLYYGLGSFMEINVVFRTFKASHTRVTCYLPSLPSPMGPKQASHGPTWLHMALQNLQNWNPEIWNIFLRSVGFNFDVKKDTKPMITIHHSTKTMPGKIHVNITNGIYVNANLNVCIPFLIWHRWPTWLHIAPHGFTWPNMTPWSH